jgi:hypothetical protein
VAQRPVPPVARTAREVAAKSTDRALDRLEPLPAPTLTTLAASPSADQIADAMRGSGRRTPA